MTFALKSNLARHKNKAIIRQLDRVLESLDNGGEALAAIYVDMALNVLDPSRNANFGRPSKNTVHD